MIRIAERSAGNPVFALEIARSLPVSATSVDVAPRCCGSCWGVTSIAWPRWSATRCSWPARPPTCGRVHAGRRRLDQLAPTLGEPRQRQPARVRQEHREPVPVQNRQDLPCRQTRRLCQEGLYDDTLRAAHARSAQRLLKRPVVGQGLDAKKVRSSSATRCGWPLSSGARCPTPSSVTRRACGRTRSRAVRLLRR